MQPKLSILIEDIRSAYNVGSVFRTADSAGVDTLYITGYTCIPPHPKLQKTALGATQTVNWQHHCHSHQLAAQLQQQGSHIIVLEPLPQASSIYQFKLEDLSNKQASKTEEIVLVFGNEVAGVSDKLVKLADQLLKIPHYGHKDSLNIAVATGITTYEFRRKISQI